MQTLFQIIRSPVWAIGAVGLLVALPIYVVIVVLVLALRIVYTPVALIVSAMHNNEYEFRKYMSTTKNFPWFGEYSVMWRDLNRWQQSGPRH